MNIIDYLMENKSSMRSGLPIELLDIIDERSVYDGSYEGMIEFLERPGLAHVRNARFVMDDIDNGQNKIVLLYMKALEYYDDFDLMQFAAKLKRLEMHEASLEEKLANASKRSENKENKCIYKEELVME